MDYKIFISESLHNNLISDGWELVSGWYEDGKLNKEVYPNGISASITYQHSCGLMVDIYYQHNGSHSATIINIDEIIRECKARELLSITRKIMKTLNIG